MKTSLRERTFKLLHDRPRHVTFKQIEEDTGISEAWLRAFSQGRYKAISVDNIQTLYEYLARKPLEV